MPIFKGPNFYQYGNQKKYYFTTPRGEKLAHKKAIKQALAILISEKKIKPKNPRKK